MKPQSVMNFIIFILHYLSNVFVSSNVISRKRLQPRLYASPSTYTDLSKTTTNYNPRNDNAPLMNDTTAKNQSSTHKTNTIHSHNVKKPCNEDEIRSLNKQKRRRLTKGKNEDKKKTKGENIFNAATFIPSLVKTSSVPTVTPSFSSPKPSSASSTSPTAKPSMMPTNKLSTAPSFVAIGEDQLVSSNKNKTFLSTSSPTVSISLEANVLILSTTAPTMSPVLITPPSTKDILDMHQMLLRVDIPTFDMYILTNNTALADATLLEVTERHMSDVISKLLISDYESKYQLWNLSLSILRFRRRLQMRSHVFRMGGQMELIYLPEQTENTKAKDLVNELVVRCFVGDHLEEFVHSMRRSDIYASNVFASLSVPKDSVGLSNSNSKTENESKKANWSPSFSSVFVIVFILVLITLFVLVSFLSRRRKQKRRALVDRHRDRHHPNKSLNHTITTSDLVPDKLGVVIGKGAFPDDFSAISLESSLCSTVTMSAWGTASLSIGPSPQTPTATNNKGSKKATHEFPLNDNHESDSIYDELQQDADLQPASF